METLGGMTVGSMVAGRTLPLSNMEHFLWNKYRTAVKRLEQQQGKGKKR